MARATSYRILIIDDHQIVIDGLTALLAEAPDYDVIASANNGRDGLRLIGALRPDVVLMDIDMPIMNGLATMDRIRIDYPELPVVILSLHLERSIIRKMQALGAKAYLLKHADKQEVLDAVKVVADGGTYYNDEVRRLLDLKDKPIELHRSASDLETLSQLTEREIEIVRAVADGLSNREIGERLFISHRTVDTHRNNIMKKIGVHKVVGLIKFAIRNGLVEG